jgi:hypothetical protein
MMNQVKDTFSAFGDRAIEVVDKVGRKRALIGLAILAAATAGAIVAVKLIRNRKAAAADEGDEAAATAGATKKRGRQGKRNSAADTSVTAQ